MSEIVPRELIREETAADGSDVTTFSFAERSRSHEFREEIAIEQYPGGSIGYRDAWGMPGGEFADRSAVMRNPAASGTCFFRPGRAEKGC